MMRLALDRDFCMLENFVGRKGKYVQLAKKPGTSVVGSSISTPATCRFPERWWRFPFSIHDSSGRRSVRRSVGSAKKQPSRAADPRCAALEPARLFSITAMVFVDLDQRQRAGGVA